MASNPAKAEKTWQQRKSEITRTALLDAAVDCFYELGYARTTTDNIARQAGVSRGAMLHHYPTRFDLIRAAVQHINLMRLAWFTEEETRIQQGAEHSRVEEGIDDLAKSMEVRVYGLEDPVNQVKGKKYNEVRYWKAVYTRKGVEFKRTEDKWKLKSSGWVVEKSEELPAVDGGEVDAGF